MTPDERIEKLLNRAGQTISDLPKATIYEFAYCLGKEDVELVFGLVRKFEFCNHKENLDLELVDYILHLTDIIDRMELALENVCGERDYLRQTAGVDGCWTCTNSDSGMECHRPEGCVLNDEGRCAGYEYAGIPEDWRVDDERPADA